MSVENVNGKQRRSSAACLPYEQLFFNSNLKIDAVLIIIKTFNLTDKFHYLAYNFVDHIYLLLNS